MTLDMLSQLSILPHFYMAGETKNRVSIFATVVETPMEQGSKRQSH